MMIEMEWGYSKWSYVEEFEITNKQMNHMFTCSQCEFLASTWFVASYIHGV